MSAFPAHTGSCRCPACAQRRWARRWWRAFLLWLLVEVGLGVAIIWLLVRAVAAYVSGAPAR